MKKSFVLKNGRTVVVEYGEAMCFSKWKAVLSPDEETELIAKIKAYRTVYNEVCNDILGNCLDLVEALQRFVDEKQVLAFQSYESEKHEDTKLINLGMMQAYKRMDKELCYWCEALELNMNHYKESK